MTEPCTESNRLESIEAKLEKVVATLGEAPNEATSFTGTGMARVIVDLGVLMRDHIRSSNDAFSLAKAQADARVKSIKIIAAAVTTAITTIAGVVAATYTVGGQ